MKKILKNQIDFKRALSLKHYPNGQIAVFVQNFGGELITELFIMHDSIELASNEFILKDYSENRDLAQEYIKSDVFTPSNRFILIGSYLCPICQITS